MPEWLIEAFLKGGPYALCAPLAMAVVTLWRENTRLRDQATAAQEKYAAETAARQERHATAIAALHEKVAAEVASLHARHDTAIGEMTEARIEEMGRVTTAVVSLAQTAQVLDKISDRALPLPERDRQPSRPRLSRGGSDGA